MRRLLVVLSVVLPAVGCGGGGGSGIGADYEREASALCRELNAAAFAEQISFLRAAAIYDRFGDRLAELPPPDDLRRTHEVLVRFARGSARFYAGAEPDAPTFDPAATVGPWEDDIPRVERELPDCADSLTGTHPEIQVIR